MLLCCSVSPLHQTSGLGLANQLTGVFTFRLHCSPYVTDLLRKLKLGMRWTGSRMPEKGREQESEEESVAVLLVLVLVLCSLFVKVVVVSIQQPNKQTPQATIKSKLRQLCKIQPMTTAKLGPHAHTTERLVAQHNQEQETNGNKKTKNIRIFKNKTSNKATQYKGAQILPFFCCLC